ncbi:MAG: RNA 2',3'-cyclic phosphodiesterase [Candidatus Doudnabacteria bacterium]
MRLFIAIPLPETTKRQVEEITNGRLPIPYINTTNLHITLNYFGELSDAEVEKVKSCFLSFVHGQAAIAVEFQAIAKVHNQLHITLKENQALKDLRARLEEDYRQIGFSFQDRSYYPHVNLGNLHMDNVMNRQRKMENFPNQELKKLSFKAETVLLYESKLLLHHPKYIPLLEALLS